MEDQQPIRGVTLNSLLDERRSLNRRLLLAVQLRDADAQAELQTALDEINGEINRLLAGTLRH